MCLYDVIARDRFGELDEATNTLGESVLDVKWIHGSWYGEESENEIDITTEMMLHNHRCRLFIAFNAKCVTVSMLT